MSEGIKTGEPPLAETSPRAGLIRRLVAFLADMLIVLIPFQIIGILLFPATDGIVQNTAGIFTNEKYTCRPAAVPPDLSPKPPANANYATLCSKSFLDMESARLLTVGRRTTQGSSTLDVYTRYHVNTDNEVIAAYDLVYLVLLVWFAYKIAFEKWRSQTFGKRWLDLRVVRQADPQSLGWRPAVIRNLLLPVSALPALVLMAYATAFGIDSLGMDYSSRSWLIIGPLAFGVVLLLAAVQIVLRTNAWHDR